MSNDVQQSLDDLGAAIDRLLRERDESGEKVRKMEEVCRVARELAAAWRADSLALAPGRADVAVLRAVVAVVRAIDEVKP